MYSISQELTLEACVETLELAAAAEANGAHRIELCTDLHTGGLTPSGELIQSVRSWLSLPIMVMIRPRAGDFFYTQKEQKEMKRQIDICKTAGVAGVVFGLLTPTREIDIERTSNLAEHASPLQVTFHKAIDETPDPVEAVRLLSELGSIHRVLTSGGAATALEGKETLKKMIDAAGNRITVLVAGKVTRENLPIVHEAIGAREYHGRRIVF
jgi:copper homeostasis protein